MPRHRVRIFDYVCDGCNRCYQKAQRSDDLVPPPRWQIFLRSKRVGYNVHTVHEFYCDACQVPDVNDENPS